jgi:hypothetical protein
VRLRWTVVLLCLAGFVALTLELIGPDPLNIPWGFGLLIGLIAVGCFLGLRLGRRLARPFP